MGHNVLYPLFIEVGRLGREPFLNTILQLFVIVNLLTGKKSLGLLSVLHLKSLITGKKFNSDDKLKDSIEKWLKSQTANF
jgi:hypothetical protein